MENRLKLYMYKKHCPATILGWLRKRMDVAKMKNEKQCKFARHDKPPRAEASHWALSSSNSSRCFFFFLSAARCSSRAHKTRLIVAQLRDGLPDSMSTSISPQAKEARTTSFSASTSSGVSKSTQSSELNANCKSSGFYGDKAFKSYQSHHRFMMHELQKA